MLALYTHNILLLHSSAHFYYKYQLVKSYLKDCKEKVKKASFFETSKRLKYTQIKRFWPQKPSQLSILLKSLNYVTICEKISKVWKNSKYNVSNYNF